MQEELPEQYLEGLRLFNEEDFFECHDVLEELWNEVIGEERLFIQGMIQAAVALFHFGNENMGGARKLYNSAREKLIQYDSPYMGIDLQQFLQDFQFCFQELSEWKDGYPSHLRLRDERVPKIKMPDTENPP